MKKIIYSLLLITGLSLVSCNNDNNPNEDKFNADPESGEVVFTAPTEAITLVGSCGAERTLVIPITLTAPVNKDGLEVNVSITELTGSASGIVVESASIPKDSLNGEVVISYPESLSTSTEFLITLESTSNSNVSTISIFGDELESQLVRINFGDRNVIQGNYSVLNGANTYDSVITAGTADNEILVSNLFGNDPDSSTRVFLNSDGTLSFPPTLENFLFVGSGTQGNVYVSDASTGTYDACAGTLSITFRLRFGPNQASQTNPVTAVFTRPVE